MTERRNDSHPNRAGGEIVKLLIITLLIVATTAVADTRSESEATSLLHCAIGVLERPHFSINAYCSCDCPAIDELFGSGALLVQESNKEHRILFGCFESFSNREGIDTLSLDGDDIPEVLLRYEVEDNFWGYLLRIRFEDGVPEVQTIKLPYLGISFLLERTGEYFHFRNDSTLVFNGLSPNDDSVAVVFDRGADSLLLSK